MKNFISPILGIWILFYSGQGIAQLSSEQQELIDNLIKKNSLPASASQLDATNHIKSPEIYGEQDSLFYQIPTGSRPPGASSISTNSEIEADTLRIFGYNMFEGSPESFSAVLEAVPPPDYRLGPGDNVVINVWGRVEMQLDLTIDREGKLFIPKAGEIVAWGMTVPELDGRVRQSLSQIYSEFNCSVSLGKIRRIKIFVYGEVKRPGGYTMSSLSTLFNAIYLSGGPNATGSLRKIKHIRNTKIISEVDLYQFLMKGDNSQDRRLESGDVIFVPVVGPQVSILGKINRPAIYELLGGENVRDLIDLAGGPSADAFLEMVSIDRVGNDDSRVVYDIDLTGNAIPADTTIILRNGDYVNVPSVSEVKKNIVKLYGHVKHPGVYGLTDSMRISDLIEYGKQLKRDSYLKRANLFRTHPDQTRQIYAVNIDEILTGIDSTNFFLMEKDSLVIYSQSDVKRQMTVSISGAVKSPGIYEYYENMRLSDLIFLAGNTLKQSYLLQAEIARTTPGNPSEILFANLDNALINKPKDDIALQEDDRVFIRTMPSWKVENKVTVEGEVTFPGEYAITSEDEKLTDLFGRCGGFTSKAFPKGMVYIRKSIEDDLIRRKMNSLLTSSEPLLLDSLNNPIQTVNIDINLDRVNRIVVDVERLLKDPDSHQNISLQNGDYIYVPEMPSGVYVLGAVASNGTIAFKNDKNANYFIKAAGGFAGQAEKKHTRLVKANGEVLSGYTALHARIEPGDAIVVPSKIIKERNWLGTTATIATIVSSVATAFLLANSIK